MKGVLQGLRNHDVVLLRGDTKRDLVREFIQTRFKCTFFSVVDLDMKRVSSSLQAQKWDGGTRPVIVFYHCEPWMRELAPVIRNRQQKQAVLLVSDGIYTPQTPLMMSFVSTTVVAGRLGPSVFSALKTGRSTTSDSSKRDEKVEETPHPERYKVAIACSDLDTIIDQIHHVMTTSLEDACHNADTLSDIDSLRYRVSDDITSHCLPVLPTITYKSQTKRRKRHTTNHEFANTLPAMVAKTTRVILGLHETLEYIRSAHQIQVSPQLVQCPRDDSDPLWVTNVNDKIRVLVCPTSMYTPLVPVDVPQLTLGRRKLNSCFIGKKRTRD
jgi:hypothetical protein